MSTHGKHRRWARKQAILRCHLIRRLAILAHEEAKRRSLPSPACAAFVAIGGGFAGLEGLMPTRSPPWPYGTGQPYVTGTIGGRSRA